MAQQPAETETSAKCPYGALRGICGNWAHCPVCGPDMWLRIWSSREA